MLRGSGEGEVVGVNHSCGWLLVSVLRYLDRLVFHRKILQYSDSSLNLLSS